MSARRAATRHPAIGPRVAAGLTLYLAAALVLVAFDVHAALQIGGLPAWVPLVAPLAAYGGLAALWLAPAALPRVPLVFAAMAMTHLALVGATGVLLTAIDAPALEDGLARGLWDMPLFLALQLACVVWMLRPLGERAGLLASPARSPRPVMRHIPPVRPAPRAGTPAPEETSPPSVPARPPAGEAPEGSRAPAEDVVDGPPQPAAASLPVASTRPSAERVEDVVRIRFERVAGQFPAGIFLLPIERVAANLLEAEHLLVPQRLVAPQLVEGQVHVSWDVVAEQFPRQALALPDAEISRRLGGRLVLPLDDVVSQLPPEAFTLSSPTLDVRGLEDFPLPFQPHVPGPGDGGPPASPRQGTLADESERPASGAAAPPAIPADAKRRPVGGDASPRPPGGATGSPPGTGDPAGSEALETWLADAGTTRPTATEEAPPEPAPMPRGLHPSAGVAGDPAPPGAGDRDALDTYAIEHELQLDYTPESAPDEGEPDEIAARDGLGLDEPIGTGDARGGTEVAAARARQRVELAEVGALLSPLVSPLELDERFERGWSLVTAVSPAIDVDGAVSTALPFLRFMADACLGQLATQATIRATRAWLVLTPIASAPPGEAYLLTAVPPGAPLAMIERASLRAAGGEIPGGGVAVPARRRFDREDAELHAASVPPAVRTVAGSLQAFGPLVPAVLRDRAGTLVLYLFLSPDADAGAVARFVRGVRRDFSDTALGAVSSAVFRAGARRLVVWELDAGRGCATVLVAAGPVDRPGLARIELERAALRLAALREG